MHWLGARDEVKVDCSSLPPAFGAEGAPRTLDIWCVGPDIWPEKMGDQVDGLVRWHTRKSCYEDAVGLPAPHLCCMFCPGLDFAFNQWARGVQHALSFKVPIIVTGYSSDQSAVQDLDIMVALGGAVLVAPFWTSCGIQSVPW
jgi:hypothetical protein